MIKNNSFLRSQFCSIFGFIIIVTLHAYFQLGKLNTLENKWNYFTEEINSKDVMLSSLKDELGFNGMIHNFKNYLLRQESKYYKNAIQNFHNIEDTLVEVQNLQGITTDEIAQLQKIKRTAEKYKSALNQIHENQHIIETDLLTFDKKIRIDDQEAIEALTWFKINQTQLKIRISSLYTQKILNTKNSFLLSIFFMFLLFLGVQIFIFKKMKLNNELITKNNLLSFLQEETNDGWWEWRLDSNYHYMSQKFWKILDYLPEEMPHHHQKWREVIHPKDMSKLTMLFSEHFQEQESGHLCELEVRHKHKAGHWVTVLLKAKVIEWSKSGKALKMIGAQTNITKLKKAQKNLIIQKERSLHSERMASVGAMSANIAHELNNPLTILAGLSMVIKTSLQSKTIQVEKISDAATNIENTVNRISTVVRGLKNISRDSSRDEFTEFNLFDVLKELELLSRDRSIRHKIHLTFPSPDEASKKLFGSEAQISQVLLNLFNNSFDAIKDYKDRWVKVEVSENQEFVEIAVIDSGKGIPQELSNKLMRPFFTTKKAGEGTGIGLSISQSIAENHHGKLWIDNTCPNTKIVLSLPRKMNLEA